MNKGIKVKIFTTDEDNGKTGTVESVWNDGYSVYIEGDEGAKFFEKTELRLIGENAATEKQMNYIVDLGGQTGPYTKLEASQIIECLKPSCHYCGMPATGFGFFDEPVCGGCGG
jgi:hypothetical protein